MVGFSVAHSVSMSVIKLNSVAGFHCHTIIKTIQQIKSRIKEIKEEEYSNSLAKIQVCEMFRAESSKKCMDGDAMFVSLSEDTSHIIIHRSIGLYPRDAFCVYFSVLGLSR